VAGRMSGDRPAGFRNGSVEGQQDSSDAGVEALERNQTLSDREQTLADSDQTGADSDQTAADDDQAAADADQAASDRDLAHGGDPREHDLTRELRERSTRQRHQIAQARVDTAASRDRGAHARDMAAIARDQAAEQHDRELDARDAAWIGIDGAQNLLRATDNRLRAAADRAAAAEGRVRAAADRQQAAEDRKQAGRDRLASQSDRGTLLQQLAVVETDELTGARTRAAGLIDLEHEIDRARGTTGVLSFAYLNVVGANAGEDARGPAASDVLLQHAVRAIRGQMHSYDLLVRLGGSEFLCAVSGATLDDARERFAWAQAELAADPEPCQIRVSFAALAPEDTASDLFNRGGAEVLPPPP
jgi:GGDEF domain-containing protein